MLLSGRVDGLMIPETSSCIIHTTGEIKDGEIVSITSPVFTSYKFTSRDININDSFEVPIKVTNGIIINDAPDGSFIGTLVCFDNDVFHMYVRV